MKLCFPVNYVAITNGYTSSHQAIDLGWQKTKKVPILSCFDGVVSNIYNDNKYGGGLTLTIKYTNGFSSDFKHLSKTLAKVGDNVSQFDEVAIMGDSGWASKGTHLHFNLYLNDERVNPLDYCYLYPSQNCKSDDKNIIKFYEEGENMKFNIDDDVIVNGKLYLNSNADTETGQVVNKLTKITRIAKGSKHPYNTTGDLGWMDEEDIRFYEEPTVDYKTLYETEVAKNNILQNKINEAINILQ